MKLKGIDVSEHQGIINWDKVKGQVDFAIIRVGYGDNMTSQDDSQFKRNIQECTRLGIPVGVYIYSYAVTIDHAKSEAEHVLRNIKGYKLDYPVYLDLEDEGTTGTLDNSVIASIAKTFCDIIEAARYHVGIYANTYWFNNKLTSDIFNRYDKWVAEYNSNCNYRGNYGIWQFTDSGTFNGINGQVDTNYCYVDYQSIIKKSSLNGSEKNLKIYRNVVVYAKGSDADECIAKILSWKLEDCIVVNHEEYVKGMGKSVYSVGALTGVEANVYIRGKNREETLKLAEERVGLR